MLRLKLTHRILGQYLAKPIYNKEGKLLLAEETMLTEPILKNLREQNIYFGYVNIFPELLYKDELFPDNQKILLLNSIYNLHEIIKRIIPVIADDAKRPELYKLSDSINSELYKIVSGLIDIAFYLDDSSLVNFIEYRFMFPFHINKIIMNLIYSAYIAKALKLNKTDIEKLLGAVIAADAGFYKLPDKFLNPNYYVSESDYNEILKHPYYSFDILRNIIGFDSVTASLTYMSHERIDGSGYPRKLKNDEINFLAQIIGIANTFTELKYSPRYKNMLSPELIYNLISGQCFGKNLSDIFIASVPPYPIGTTVFLNDSELGVVTGFDKNFPFNPTVRKIDAGNLYDSIVEYDLKLDKTKKITGYAW
ncbi:MAG TPA: HD domain-containing phosphohydrolase [bacterium]|nr:HD domain-containing phosphohydrolase [bacterium]